ncbi:MAG: GGDEF domain-containing protein [Clostridium sp.]|nr:GGDEF domain-containing protein [Clostridium sp.]
MNKRKNIALFVAMLENEFSHAICEGALMGAKEIDANLFILPAGIVDAKYDDFDSNCYRYQYNTLYSFIKSNAFDAIIIEYGTVMSFLDEQQKREFLQEIGDVPVILLAGQQEGHSSICVDNKAGLSETILHLTDEHHCTKIGFVSGPVSTSLDAKERLDVFKETMAKRNLPAGDDWIAYGNFSEFSEDVVEELLERHPDIEAIVCANDQMAVGAYNVLKKHKLCPGEDILITGFDDSPTAMLLEPNLTSVRADTRELAYLAVMECPNVMKGEIVNKSVKSRMVTRKSCGCGDKDEHIIELAMKSGDNHFVKKLAEEIFDQYYNNYFESKQTRQMRELLEEYIDYFFRLIDDDGNLHLNLQELGRAFYQYSETYNAGYINLNLLLSINHMLYDYVSPQIAKEADRLSLLAGITKINQDFMDLFTKQMMASSERSKVFQMVLANITRDILQFSDYELKKYKSILDKLMGMDFPSGYVLSYGCVIEHKEDEVWEEPDTLYMRAFYDEDNVCIFEGEEESVAAAELFLYENLPSTRRYDMIVLPLFSKEEQYGLILAEAGVEEFSYVLQIASQVSVSLEVLEILNKQNALKQELELNLAKMVENNRVLDIMSHSDPLTGIANRRGFLDTVSGILKDERNYGRKAIAVYADMDNLKIVNDEFGHDEGDFSLKTIANALSESFRQSDVVARMGGDEFAAFAIISHDHFADELKQRIHSILAAMNENDKPYYVNMSIGTYEFVIGEDTNLDHVLNVADTNLYKEKKNKKKVVYKNLP